MARRALSATQEVEVLSDGSVLLERISNTRILPDALVVDWQLEGISGIEVCRVIRQTYDGMRLPILMLTAQAEKTAVVEAITAGANDYVVKPYEIVELVARVATLVRTSRLQSAQYARTMQLALSADIGEAITKGQNIAEIARRCTGAIVVHLEARNAQIWERSDGKLTLLASTSASGAQHDDVTVTDVIERVCRDQRPLVIEDPAELARLHACGAGLRSFVVLPLVLRDDTQGVIAFCSHISLADALPALTTISDLLALGMARARAETERVHLLERERHARAEAEAANRSKDEFLAMVSHELRTPLNAITGWTGMLMRGEMDAPRVKRALETIDRNARSQAQLIEDLLDIGRIVSGKLRVDVSSVDVASVAELALEAVRLAADAKGIVLDSGIEHAGTVLGDPDRIQQVIWNLLTNAIKFTKKGDRVVLRVHRRDGGVEILVEDTGQGIDPEFLPHVFERFKQADGTSTRAKGGLGLGLSIVKNLVELHGGTIQARSDGLGLGASFLVYLPMVAAPRESEPPVSLAMPPRAGLERPRELEGIRALVVDDEPDARELLRTLLESCKMVVTVVETAAEAFDVARSGLVDVLVSDIAMPQEDGLSLIRRIRELPRDQGGRLPAMAVTAYARLEDRTRALRAGFNSHVAKPVDPGELLAVLVSLTSR
ncbi:MAG: two-component hybrid sensor and regulator [Labilithrix sp.]|nr:two-component hybrid sensor and regulator [Labilithrix sp.]